MFRNARVCTSTILTGMLCLLAAPPGHAASFDLKSPDATLQPGALLTSPARIIVGGRARMVQPSSFLTPAEMVAVNQVLTAGRQSILINRNGVAIGGSFKLPMSAAESISELVIPRNVRALADFSATDVLKIGGDLTNSGRLFAYSGINATNHSGSFDAENIINNRGGLITSLLTNSLRQTLGASAAPFNLGLHATGSLINEGTIRSSGSLNMSAEQITNHGLISSMTGNLTLAGTNPNLFAINGLNGTFSALNGNINLNMAGVDSASILRATGGNFLSNELNINAGEGKIVAKLDDVTGWINATACSASVGAFTKNLKLGTISISGDPSFYNANGSLTLNPSSFITGYTLNGLWIDGQDLALLASGDIIFTGDSRIVTVNQSGGNGGDLTIIAGAKITTSDNSTSGAWNSDTILTVSGPSATGGAIDLSGCLGIATMGKYVNAANNGIGGNILLVAYDGSGEGSTRIPGTIKIPSLAAFDQNVGNNLMGGKITIISGATSVPSGELALEFIPKTLDNPPNSVSSGQLGTHIYQATPVGTLTIRDGSIIQGSITPGQLQQVDIGSPTKPIPAWFLYGVNLHTAGNIYLNHPYELVLENVTFGSVFQVTSIGAIYISRDIVGLNSDAAVSLVSTLHPNPPIIAPYAPAGVLVIGAPKIHTSTLTYSEGEDHALHANRNWQLSWIPEPVTELVNVLSTTIVPPGGSTGGGGTGDPGGGGTGDPGGGGGTGDPGGGGGTGDPGGGGGTGDPGNGGGGTGNPGGGGTGDPGSGSGGGGTGNSGGGNNGNNGNNNNNGNNGNHFGWLIGASGGLVGSSYDPYGVLHMYVSSPSAKKETELNSGSSVNGGNGSGNNGNQSSVVVDIPLNALHQNDFNQNHQQLPTETSLAESTGSHHGSRSGSEHLDLSYADEDDENVVIEE